MQNENPQEVVTTGNTQLVAPIAKPKSYIATMLEANRNEFLEANEGMDMDYVRQGEWLKISAKGNFIESQDESISYGDTIDVVVGLGEQRYMLWGKKDTPEEGQLITAESAQEQAEAALHAWLDENPDRAVDYSADDIKLRYLAFIVPIQAIQEAAATGEIPKVYMIGFAPGDTFGWGNYVRNIFNGKYKVLGVPSKVGVNRVVTRMTTEERSKGNDKWIGIKFECVGLFKPEEFGIQE